MKTEVLAEENEPSRKRTHISDNEPKKQVLSESKAVKLEQIEKDSIEHQAQAIEHEYPSGVKDLDSEDLDDPLMAAEYANEIFEYLRDLEVKSIPNPQYMDHQDDIGWRTRGHSH